MHHLDDAYEQINGAREHLDTLKPEIDNFRQIIANKVSLKYKRGIINIKGKQLNVPIGTATAPFNQPAPPRASRLIGEVIQSLRKALDYLVYELACFDSKSIVEQTQFVIVDSENDFKKNIWHLKGLTGEHIAMFQRLQPYNGCHWTKLIRDLSNPDKHKTLTAIRHFTGIHIDPTNTEEILAGKQVNMDDYATIEITFIKGPPVIAGLQQLVINVIHTLDEFKPEFQR